ncbi:MAG TPA: SDR family oxidoreductase [Myxococcaceae bacterium]|nr:SDR family oxidoreductase [Myxococcaceae bacterium]
MDDDPSAPVVVITGASAGIGAALARELAGRHAALVLAARREEILREMAVTLGGAVEVVPADVTRRADVQRVLDQALARFGRVDVWVNNAGRGISRPSVLGLSDEDLEAMFRDNTRSALYGMQAAVPHFQARGQGVLVNVSSMLSRTPRATMRAAYSASKAALNSLTESLRFELAATHPNIRVVLVLPGVVATDFGLHALGGGPDSRTLPGAQPVEEVARAIADGLFSGPLDVYTRPEGVEPVLQHLRGLAGR